MRTYLLLPCLALLALGFAGCGNKSDVKDIGDTKTRESEAKNNMQNVLSNDPSLLKGSNNAGNPAMPHAAPPGAPMGSAR